MPDDVKLSADELDTIEAIARNEQTGRLTKQEVLELVRAYRPLPSLPSDIDGLVKEIEQRKDAAYEERNKVVAALAHLFPSGIKNTNIPGWSPDWHGCVYIDLPTGQVSWHFHDSQRHLFDGLAPYQGEWDGHDTEEKYRRLAALRARQAPVNEACPNCGRQVIADNAPATGWIAACGRRLSRLDECGRDPRCVNDENGKVVVPPRQAPEGVVEAAHAALPPDRQLYVTKDDLRAALSAMPSGAVKATDGLSEWQGWDQSREPWGETKHKDAVLEALFRGPWSVEDAAALIGFIDRTWTKRPAGQPS